MTPQTQQQLLSELEKLKKNSETMKDKAKSDDNYYASCGAISAFQECIFLIKSIQVNRTSIEQKKVIVRKEWFETDEHKTGWDCFDWEHEDGTYYDGDEDLIVVTDTNKYSRPIEGYYLTTVNRSSTEPKIK